MSAPASALAPPRPRALRSGSARLVLAAALCVVSLGVGWDATQSSEGYVTPGYTVPNGYTSPVTGEYTAGPGQYYAGTYVTGTPGTESPGFESGARVLLVPALAALAVASRRRTKARQAERLALAATWSLAGAAVLAIGTAVTAAAVVSTVAALAAAASVTWPALADRVDRLTDVDREHPVSPPTVAPTAF